ncbi:IS66-like element accessory protein TnpA [Yunchengibacter salinarum]|uniref:IS66-like element accessory protein TnpA n=1 Tax=Yunchengibacter salinarum TaxID=3133399 RepID=UPI0035B679FA
MRGEVLGIERRRRWCDDDKLAIVSSVGVDGATVTQVARRHDVSRQQIYAWRHELKRKGLWSPEEGALFLPINGPAAPCALAPWEAPAAQNVPAAPCPAASVSVELRLAKGRCLRFDSGLDEAAVMRLIRAVEAA